MTHFANIGFTLFALFGFWLLLGLMRVWRVGNPFVNLAGKQAVRRTRSVTADCGRVNSWPRRTDGAGTSHSDSALVRFSRPADNELLLINAGAVPTTDPGHFSAIPSAPQATSRTPEKTEPKVTPGVDHHPIPGLLIRRLAIQGGIR
jgi:hypothetical protein